MNRMRPDEIKKLRSDLGWSQRKLGQYLGGYNANAVYKWEHGEAQPPGPVVGLLVHLRQELDKRENERLKREFIQALASAAVAGGIVAFMDYLFNKNNDDEDDGES